MSSINVLLVGSGGREHALAWKIAQSSRLKRLFVAPGNPGTAALGENVPIAATDIDRLVAFAQEHEVDLTVIGPDDPLALGIVDSFRAANLKVFGPACAAAKIESSKAFAKRLMQDSGIPTAGFQVFSDYEPARAYVYEQDLPVVIKASGLALGKGVYVCNTLQEAEQALEQIMRRSVHGEAGSEVVVEEYLDGPEISVHALSDGKNFILFPPAQDHKRIGDGDTGPNTGGMGTIAPIPFVSAQTMESIGERIVRPVLQALQKSGAPFSGVLYPGLKMTSTGPKVLEFNARFGDPETQVYMRLLKSDILDLLEACAAGDVSSQKPEWNSGFAANIVLASKGYPESYEKGFPIRGIADAEKKEDVVIFHAGTTYDLPAGASAQAGGELKTAGGRVLGVSAIAPTLRVALERAYAAAARIEFEGKYFRRDIGVQALFLG